MITIKKYIILFTMLFLSIICCHTYAEEAAVEVSRSAENVVISGVVNEAAAYSEIGITLFKSEYSEMDFSTVNGELTDVIASYQATLDLELRFSVSLSVDSLPYGDITVRIGSVYLSEPLEYAFKILKVNVSGNMQNYCDKNGDYKILGGETFTVKLSASSEIPLKHLKVNGIIKLSEVGAEATYTTEELYENSYIVYKFYGGSTNITNLDSPDKYYLPDLSGNLTLEERKLLSDKAVAIISAKADEFYNDYVLVEAGYFFSLNAEDLTNSLESCEKIAAGEISSEGTFAIMFYADSSLKGRSFSAKPYAIYKNEDGNTLEAYGNIKNFVLKDVAQHIVFEDILIYNKLNTDGIKVYELN